MRTGLLVVALCGTVLTAPALASDVVPGSDVWYTPCGATYDFNPIPADFFTASGGTEGSNAYTDGILFCGTPLTTNPPDFIIPADTIVVRSERAILPACPSEDTVPIEILALSLRSASPITVTYPSAPDEVWNVDVCLAPGQSPGSLTIRHECASGGTYDASLPVLPQFTFTRVVPNDGTVLTWIPPNPVVLGSSGAWVHEDPGFSLTTLFAGILIDADCDGTPETAPPVTPLGPEGFFPGFEADDCTCASPGGGSFRKKLTPEQALLAAHGVYVSNVNNKPQEVGACCTADGCTMTGEGDCIFSLGGTTLGVGVQCDPDPCGGTNPPCGDGACNPAAGETYCNCPLDCGRIPEFCTDGADNDCDGDVDCADADCASDPACGTLKCVGPGDDCFTTACDGTTSYDFSQSPIPAGFFCGTDSGFAGTVPLGGQTGFVDTVVRRHGPLCHDEANLPSTDVVAIELVQLSLTSCSPIVVQGCPNPQWDVYVTIPPPPSQPQGTMTATKVNPSGGTFNAQLPVNAQVCFGPAGSGGCSTPFIPAAPVQLNSIGSPWLQNCSSCFSPCNTGGFSAGSRIDTNTGQACCEPTCHQGPAPGHEHCTTPPKCPPCTDDPGADCPLANNFCLDRAAAGDCEGDAASELCWPKSVRTVAGGGLQVDACECFENECGPVDMVQNAVGEWQFRCLFTCPNPSLPCVIHLDGRSTGQDSISEPQTQGRQVTCECAPPRDPHLTVQGTSLTFGSDDIPPVPADFFYPGCLPFEGIVNFIGAPGDTQVQRERAVNVPALGAQDIIPIEIVALNLVSVQPITLSPSGQQWDVAVTLSDGVPPDPPGTITVTRHHANGGTFDAHIPVAPKLVFTEVGNPGNVKTIDFRGDLIPDVQINFVGADWVENLGPDLAGTILAPNNGNFVPGVRELAPGDPTSQVIVQATGNSKGGGVSHPVRPVPVPAPCCLPSGICAVLLETNCRAANGKPLPAGVACQGDNNNNGIDDACEAAECEQCGPGVHWIHQPPCPPADPNATGICKLRGENCASDADCLGFCSSNNATCIGNVDCPPGDVCTGKSCNKQSQDQDTVPSGAVLGIDLNGDCIAETSVILGGPATIRKFGPRDDSQHFPGLRPVDAHKDVVDTEILSMSLTGGGVTLLGGGGLGAIPMAPSLGAVAEQPSNPSLADSFFDVFTEISGGGLGAPAYNQTPIRVQTVIPCLPPKGTYIHVTGCTPLYDSPIPGTGNVIANLVQAKHFTFPACCRPTGTCQPNVSVQECAAQGGTTVPSCLGDGDNNGRDDACEVVCDRDPTSATGCSGECDGLTANEECLPSKGGCDPNNAGSCGVLECDCQNPNACHLEYTAAGPVCLGVCPNPPGGNCELLGDGSFDNPYHCDCIQKGECGPNAAGNACVNPSCPTADDERCLPRCVRIDPALGVSQIVDCDCRDADECHAESATLTGSGASVAGVGANPCVVPDNGGGTVTLPPAGCAYLSPDEVHEIIAGLPAGTTIELAPIHKDFICREGPGAGVCSFAPVADCTEPGGSLGGEKECAESVLDLDLDGTGALAGFNRNISIPLSFETHTAPRNPGDPVQSFDTDMFRMFGQIMGDPDFDLLRIVAGSDFGLPSPGHTTLTRLPGGNYAVDSFFDITYRIDFVGSPGGPLGGMSGSTTGTIRMTTGSGVTCVGACPPGSVCRETRTVNDDGVNPPTIDVCCDCIQPNQACCLPDGTCAQLSPDDCRERRGKVLPVGSICLGDNNGDGIDDACDADPCEECGPGVHWIDTPPCPAADPALPGICKLNGAACLGDADCLGFCSGNGNSCLSDANCPNNESCAGKRCNKEGEDQDTFGSGALLGIDLDFDCVADTNLVLGGPATVHKLGPHDDSTRFPGLRPVDAHKDVIDTEIIAMNLTGGGVTLIAGAGLGGLPLPASFGAVAELLTDPSLADSFFDVHVEVSGGALGGPAYNQTPIRVRTVVPCLPPKGKYIHFSGCTPLYDTPFPGVGNHVANLVRAQHFTFPDCCLPDGTCQALPVKTCKQLLGTPVAQCLGDSDGDGKDDACVPPVELCPLPPNEPWCVPRQGMDCTPDDVTVAQFCLPKMVKVDPASGLAVNQCDCYPDGPGCGPVTIRPIPGTPEYELSCNGVCPDGADRCVIHLGLTPPVSTGQKSILSSSVPPGAVVTCDCPPDEVGACCYQDGSCAAPITKTECDATGGVFQGAGTTCADNNGNGRADVCEADVCEPSSDGSKCEGPCNEDPCFGECIGGAYCDGPDPSCCLEPGNCLCYEKNTKESIRMCGDCFGECINGAYCDNTANPDCCIIPGACACYLPNSDISIQLCQDNPCFGECINGSYCDSTANPNCCINPGACACYIPEHPISVKLCGRPLPTPDRCQARCVKFNPLTGKTEITECDCASKNECHVDLTNASTGAGAVAVAQGGAGNPCVVPDNGGGTVTLPPAGCEYLSPDEVHEIIDGLPSGTTIELAAIHKDFICHKQAMGPNVCSFPPPIPGVDCDEPGGSLGGEKECSSSTLHLNLNGTGDLAGFHRLIPIPISFETHVAPRTPGDPVQSFDTDMFRLFGQAMGDPDFDLLRIVAGTDFGMPSPGHTTLTRLPGGNYTVDSFFDIEYRIDFVGSPGSVLGGRSGSTTGTIRMSTGSTPKCAGGCPVVGQNCSERRTLNADGTIDICCDCGCPADPVNPPKPEPTPVPVPKIRYLTMVPNNPGRLTALRVTVRSSGTHTSLTGTEWWVTDPRLVCENSGQVNPPDPGNPPTFGCAPSTTGPRAFRAAGLGCAPDCRDWGALGQIDVSGQAIVPNSVFDVQAIDCTCLTFNDEGNFSGPLTLTTSRWGDLVSDNTTQPPGPPNSIVDGGDIVGVLNKFKNVAASPRKARADLEPAMVDRLILGSDITRTLDAFSNDPYPFAPPSPCP